MSFTRPTLIRKRLKGRFGIRAPQVAIRTHLPWYWRGAAGVALLVLVIGLGYGLYDAGRRYAGFDLGAMSQELATLREQVERLESEAQQLRQKAAAGDGALQVEKSVLDQLKRQVKLLEAENARLKEDVAFFDSLIPGQETEDGMPKISGFKMEPDVTGEKYRFRTLVVLPAGKGGAKAFKGNLQLVLKVRHLGKDAIMTLPQDGAADAADFRLDIKHFQRVEGVFEVPVGAVLKGVEVRVLQDGSVRARHQLNL